MTTKYRAQTRATASSPHGATRDGKDKTQRLALTWASSNLPLTLIKTVRFIHNIQYADVHGIYMCVFYLCILLSEWGIFMEFECFSVRSLRDGCYLMPYVYLLKSVCLWFMFVL